MTSCCDSGGCGSTEKEKKCPKESCSEKVECESHADSHCHAGDCLDDGVEETEDESHVHSHCQAEPGNDRKDKHTELESHDRSHHPAEDDQDGVTCLAVVRDNGGEISLFDAGGYVRSFSFQGDIRELCFSSHGQEADDLLTPCFDDGGNHGTPDEGCFCGVDTPHLHAHKHDPRTCDDERPRNGNMEAELMNLARLTLHPVDDGPDFENTEKQERLYEIPVSERMPNECNSQAFTRHMSGADSDSDHPPAPLRKRRMYKVKHDDHFDYLVQNKTTGELHLEHPCKSCGDHDYHGKFRLVGKRKWNSGSGVQLHIFEASQRRFNFRQLFETESGRVSILHEGLKIPKRKGVPKPLTKHACCSHGPGDASVGTTSKVAVQPSCCIDNTCASSRNSCINPEVEESPLGSCSKQMDAPSTCCSSGSCSMAPIQHLETAHVDKANGLGKEVEPGSKVVRSTFVCTGICCSSEIPIIVKVLNPVDGIEKVMVNAPLKTVVVDHGHRSIAATDIQNILNENHFGASIQRDGACTAKGSTRGRSKFFVQNICCASEIPAVELIVSPLSGVENVMINVTTKQVYVDHDLSHISAQTICNALNKDGFGARIEHDAATETNTGSSFVTSVLSFEASEGNVPTTENLTGFLKTFSASQMETFLVDIPSSRITVVHNPLLISAKEIVESLSQKTGLEATISKDGEESQVWDFPEVHEEEQIEPPSAKLRPTVAISGIFWLVSMLSLIGGSWEYLKYVALLSVAFGAPPIAIKAWRTLRRFQFDANCLMFFATAGAVALQEFTEAAAVTFLFALSEWLEVRATARARNALSAIVQLRPESANLVHPQTGEIVVVLVNSVPVGALVSVRSGDKVPCDGVVVEGTSTVDESSLTGESRPVRKTEKDGVSGGTVNSGHTQLMVRTTATADDSAVARLIRLVEEAQANRSETEKLVDEFARIYTPIIVLVALAMCTIPWAWGQEIGSTWTHNGLVLIVIACPCALIISTPVSYVAGLAATAQRGILIKGGAHLEALGLVKKVCFDKTGTLTQGKFQLLHLNIIGESNTRAQVLEHLSLMEERASHPLAQALIDAARNEGISIPKELFVKDHTFMAGEGVSGMINGQTVYVGNIRLFDRLGMYSSLSDSEKQAVEDWEAIGGTVGFMSIGDDGIVCSYCVADAVRPESRQVLENLKRMGVETIMLTGDNHDAAHAVGGPIGLSPDQIKSQLLPEEKLSIVSSMKDGRTGGKSILANLFSTRRLVLMCGDGVNDAPALATADVGVAMGAGAALAMETADVTLMDSDLHKLLFSIKMGRQVIRKIKENVVFSIGVKLLVLGFALSGKAYLWAAIASDVGAMILVTLNGMLLMPSRRSKDDHSKVAIPGSDAEKGTHDEQSDCSGSSQY